MRIQNLLIISFLICVLGVSSSAAQAPTSISFQGYVTDTSGAPIDGMHSISLKLYDSIDGVSELWARTYAGVDVKDGVFEVSLEAGAPSFATISFADSLWLQIQIDSDVLTSRTQLRSVPYARGLSLPVTALVATGPGSAAALTIVNTTTTQDSADAIVGTSSAGRGRGLRGKATHSSGINYGVWGESSSTSGTGVLGLTTATSGITWGVYGRIDSDDGAGVYGRAQHATGANFGVFGRNYSDHGIGVYGVAEASSGTTYGIEGRSKSSSGRGVYGIASATSGSNIGVLGSSISYSGIGVRGTATRDFGATYGVSGEVTSPDGWSGYFSGGQGVYAISADNNRPDLMLGGSSAGTDDGIIGTDSAYASSDLWLYSNDAVIIRLDYDADGEDADFEIRNNANATIFNVDESGEVRVNGVIEHASDRNLKDGIAPVDPEEILRAVVELPISRWRYKGQSAPHLGPMAQDFHASLGVGSNETHIATVDADGVALAAIQGLYRLVKELQAENEQMRATLRRAGLE